MLVQLLGRPAITGEDGPVELRGPRQAGLLALLGVESGRVVRTSRIEDELWDGQRVSDSAVRVNVNRLRARFQSVADRDPIVSHTLGYALDLETDEIDVIHFVTAARATFAHRAQGNAAAALALADAAERWWRGPAFEGVADLPSVQADGVRLDALRTDVWQERAIALIEMGALDDALVQLDALIANSPYREAAWGLRLYALGRSGRTDEAAARFRELEDLLDRDLGSTPATAIVALAEEVRGGATDPESARAFLTPAGHDHPLLGRVGAGPASATTSPSPRRTAPAAPFVGRSALLDELVAFTTGSSPSGGIVVVEGPPGIGKTRLADEVAERVRRAGVTVLSGSCPRDGGSSVAAVADIVRGALACRPGTAVGLEALAPLVPECFGAVAATLDPDPEIRRLQLFDASSQALAAAGAPTLVIVDDVHWVSDDSGRFLHHLIERSNCRWLLLARSGARAPAAVELLADVARWRPMWRTLEPLTAEELRQLVARVAPDGDRSWDQTVLDRSGGNPFFATELLRHRADGGDHDAVPPGVGQLVTATMARLSPASVQVAEALTIARLPVPHLAVARAVDLEPTDLDSALDELVAVGLATDGDADATLAHDLIAEAIDASIGTGRRRELHTALGRALAQVAPDRCPAALGHLLEGGATLDGDELDHVAAAGLHQLNAGASFHEAASLGTRYLDVSEDRPTTPAGLAARVQVASALLTAGSFGRGRALLERIEPEVRRQGDAVLSADAILARGSVNVANPELAVQVDEARLVLDALDPSQRARRVQLAGLIAHHLALLGRPREALELLDRAEFENQPDGDTALAAMILAMRVQVASGSSGPPLATRRAFTDLAAFADRHPTFTTEMWRGLFALDQAMRDGNLDDHAAAVEALARTDARIPRPEITWAVAAARAGNSLARGRLDVAEELIIAAQTTGGELSVGSALSVWITQLFMLQYERGDLAMMTPFLSSLTENDSAYQIAARALLHIEAGDLARARDMARLLAERDALLAEAGAGWSAIASQAGDIAFAARDEDLATGVLDELADHAGTALSAHGFLHLGAADRTLGLAWATIGELDRAVEALEVAHTDDRRRGAPRWAGRAARSAATVRRVRRGRGDLAAARILDQEAARLLAPL